MIELVTNVVVGLFIICIFVPIYVYALAYSIAYGIGMGNAWARYNAARAITAHNNKINT